MATTEGNDKALSPVPKPELGPEQLRRRRAHLEAFAASLGVDATIATAVVDGLMNHRQEILNRVSHLPADGGSLELWSLDDQKFLNHLGGSLNASVWPNIAGFQIGAIMLLTLGNGSEAEYLARMEQLLEGLPADGSNRLDEFRKRLTSIPETSAATSTPTDSDDEMMMGLS